MDKMKFGKRVKAARNALGVTGEKLAELCNVSEMTIRHIETGNRGVSVEMLITLCNQLGVTPENLLLDQIEPSIYPHVAHEYVDKLTLKQLNMLSGVLKSVLEPEEYK